MSIPPLTPDPGPDQFRELLRFIREENEAYRTASRNESEAARNLLTHTIRIVAYPVTVAIAIVAGLVAFVGLRSVHDMKTSIQSEAESATKVEVQRMRQGVRDRLTEEFQTPKIQNTIREAAREATASEARPLIKAEVSRQVKIEQATISKEYGKQLENEFNRIRDFRATLHIALSPTVKNPTRFSPVTPSVYLKRNDLMIAEFFTSGVATIMSQGPAISNNPTTVLEFIHEGELYSPFKASLLNQRIKNLNGINKLQLSFQFLPSQPELDGMMEFFKGIDSVRVDLVLNSVTVHQVTVNNGSFQVPSDPKSLIQGDVAIYTVEVPLDPHFFTNSEAEYKVAAGK